MTDHFFSYLDPIFITRCYITWGLTRTQLSHCIRTDCTSLRPFHTTEGSATFSAIPMCRESRSPVSFSVIIVLNCGIVVCSIPAEVDGFLRVIKIRSTTSFGGEVKPSLPCRRFTACKRTLRAWIEMFRKQNSAAISPKSPDWLIDGSGSHIRMNRTCAVGRLVTHYRVHASRPRNLWKEDLCSARSDWK
jgi:hypothetical protein